jgi:hypothetical protein
MSRKNFFEIKHLLGKICFRAAMAVPAPACRALWMNFHGVYPGAEVIC